MPKAGSQRQKRLTVMLPQYLSDVTFRWWNIPIVNARCMILTHGCWVSIGPIIAIQWWNSSCLLDVCELDSSSTRVLKNIYGLGAHPGNKGLCYNFSQIIPASDRSILAFNRFISASIAVSAKYVFNYKVYYTFIEYCVLSHFMWGKACNCLIIHVYMDYIS